MHGPVETYNLTASLIAIAIGVLLIVGRRIGRSRTWRAYNRWRAVGRPRREAWDLARRHW